MSERLSPLLFELFARAGFEAVDLSFLQPVDLFLNAAGENIRPALFITKGLDGDVFCLRPEFTIPTCLHHIESGADAPRFYAYGGPVFCQGAGRAAREFHQVGLEAFGEQHKPSADARVIMLAAEAVRTCGLDKPLIKLGDPAFFNALVEPLGLAKGWRKRLLRGFGDDGLVNSLLGRMEMPAVGGDDAALDVEAMTDKVATLMHDHGIGNVGGRDPRQVALRLVEKQALARPVDGALVAILRAFLDIECPLEDVAGRMDAFGAAHGLNFGAAIDDFETRRAGLCDLEADVTFSARFGRPLDYYNGMVFEIFAHGGDLPVAGGGRYDGLMRLLGAPRDVPAAGFALRLDRVGGFAHE